MPKAAIGQLIDDLQAQSWLQRCPDPQDRRVNRVQLNSVKEAQLLALCRQYEAHTSQLREEVASSTQVSGLTLGLKALRDALVLIVQDR